MNRLYLATVIAASVTVLLAINLLVVAVCGSATSGMPARLWPGLPRARRRLRRVIDIAVAAMLADRERKAALFGPGFGRGRRASGGRLR
jgi:hypothetical protein